MKVLEGKRTNNNIIYKVDIDGSSETISSNSLQLLLQYGVVFTDCYGNKLTNLDDIKIVEDTPQSTTDILKNTTYVASIEEEDEVDANSIDFNEVFKNLGEDKAMQLYEGFIAQGMSEDDAFTEVYSIECNMDEAEEEFEEPDYEEDSEEEVEIEDAEDYVDDEQDVDDYEVTLQDSYKILEEKAELLKQLEGMHVFNPDADSKAKRENLLQDIRDCDSRINEYGVEDIVNEDTEESVNTWRVDLENTLFALAQKGDETAQERLRILQEQPYLEADNKISRLYEYLQRQENGQEKIDLIQNYFLWYSRRVFNRESKISPRPISIKKAAKLEEIRNSSKNWGYAGFIDTCKKGNDHCHFGHALRYVHFIWDLDEADIERYFFGDKIWNVKHLLEKENISYYKFGSTCAGDFFQLDAESLKLFEITQKAVLNSFEELCDIYESGMDAKISQYCDEIDKIVEITQANHAMMSLLFDESEADYQKTEGFYANPRLEHFYTEFRRLGIVPPKIMVMELRDSFAYSIGFYYWKSIKNRNWWAVGRDAIIRSMEVEKLKGMYKTQRGKFNYLRNKNLMYKLLELVTGYKLEGEGLALSPINKYFDLYYSYRLAGLYMYGPRSQASLSGNRQLALIDAFRSLEESGKDSTRGRGSEDDYSAYKNDFYSAPYIDSYKKSDRYYLADYNGELTDIFMPQILDNKGYTLEYVAATYSLYANRTIISDLLDKLKVKNYDTCIESPNWLDTLSISEDGDVTYTEPEPGTILFSTDILEAFDTEFADACKLLYWVYRCYNSAYKSLGVTFALSKEKIKTTKVKQLLSMSAISSGDNMIGEDAYNVVDIFNDVLAAVDIVNANIDNFTAYIQNNSGKEKFDEIVGIVIDLYKALSIKAVNHPYDLEATVESNDRTSKMIITQVGDKKVENWVLRFEYGYYRKCTFLRLTIDGNISIEKEINITIDEMKDEVRVLLGLEPITKTEEAEEVVVEEENTSTDTTLPTSVIPSTPKELLDALNALDLSGIQINKWQRDTLLADINKKRTDPNNLSDKQIPHLARLYKEATGNDYAGEIKTVERTKITADDEAIIDKALLHEDQLEQLTVQVLKSIKETKSYTKNMGWHLNKAKDFVATL